MYLMDRRPKQQIQVNTCVYACVSYVSPSYVVVFLQIFLSSGYSTVPNGKGIKGAGASNGKGLKGGVLPPEQPSAAPVEVFTPQQAITEDAAPVAPEPTSGLLVMVTQEKYQKLPSPVTQGKSYKQTPLIPEATPEPAPVIPQGKYPKPAPKPTPEPAATPAPVVLQTNQAPEPAEVLPQGKYPKPESIQYFYSQSKIWKDNLYDLWKH